ncbi:hypothetical protein [Delftia lacustris]|uniref:Uncharacterized protein n=1 Tax=Delftia lacustris TaxID=558537 RepID=A0A1H3SJP6_9BURK|nr:hypothetical protein [Delftia lacustris]SDZ37329.1 hypothetical protein SAMN05421547_12057 [Delftia lacustris]
MNLTPLPRGRHPHQALAAWMACCALLCTPARAQTSPAFGPPPATSRSDTSDDIPLVDYLGLLQKIAPAAEEGARTYLAANQLRCARTLTTAELRRAMSQGDGDPLLMGLVRAAHLKDTAARDRLVAQIPCTPGAAR